MEWPQSFDRWLAELEARAGKGDRRARRQLELVYAQLTVLTKLAAKPRGESATLKRVRQRRKYEIWRLSHPFEAGIAMRVICWFPPDDPQSVVIVAFAGDKSKAGEVFYDAVGIKADGYIDQWLREQEVHDGNA